MSADTKPTFRFMIRRTAGLEAVPTTGRQGQLSVSCSTNSRSLCRESLDRFFASHPDPATQKAAMKALRFLPAGGGAGEHRRRSSTHRLCTAPQARRVENPEVLRQPSFSAWARKNSLPQSSSDGSSPGLRNRRTSSRA